jgi:hypothetical protein
MVLNACYRLIHAFLQIVKMVTIGAVAIKLMGGVAYSYVVMFSPTDFLHLKTTNFDKNPLGRTGIYA